MNGGADELPGVLVRMARYLQDEASIEETATGIAAMAATGITGAWYAGVLLIGRAGVSTLPDSAETVASRLDETQYSEDRGPCMAVMATGEPVVAEDLGEDGRWPDFARLATGLGVYGVMAFPLIPQQSHTSKLGALSVYARQPHAFDSAAREAGALIAAGTGVALAGARQRENLKGALESREHIGEATGIVMERCKLSKQQAFEMLAQRSQDHNVKLRDLADDLVRTGELPGKQRP